MEKKCKFYEVPNRIHDLNLDPYDFAVFGLLSRYKPSFPSHRFISKKLNMSRDKVRNSLNTLEKCNLIMREKSHGRKNYYTIMPEGVWREKSVDKPKKVDRGAVHSGPPGGLVVDRQAVPNNTNLNKTNLINGPTFLKIVENMKKINSENKRKQ